MPQQRSTCGFCCCLVAFGLARRMQSIGRVLLLLLLLVVRLRSCSGVLSCCGQSCTPTCICDASALMRGLPLLSYTTGHAGGALSGRQLRVRHCHSAGKQCAERSSLTPVPLWSASACCETRSGGTAAARVGCGQGDCPEKCWHGVTLQAVAAGQLDAVTNLLPRLVETVEALGFEAEPYFG